MATVQDLFDLLEDKLLGYAIDSALEGPGGAPTAQTRKIRALNAGQHKVWQLLVGASKQHRTNWFGKSASLSFGSGSNSEALPADFHDLLWAESTDLLMKAGSQHRTAWEQDRQESSNLTPAAGEVIYYIVSGDFTPNLEISRKTTGITVDVEYTQILTDWTALANNADRIPVPFFDAVCNYAVMHLLIALHDTSGVWDYWKQLWDDDRAMITAASAQRQVGGVISEEGVDTAG